MSAWRLLFLLALSFSLVTTAAAMTGCSSEESTPESSILKPEEKPGSAEKPGRKEYPKAKAPEGKQAFRWDFSRKYKFVYDFEQKVKMDSGSGVAMPMNATATLSMNAKGDNTANMVLSDMEVDMMPGMKQPPMVLQGVTEDSKIPGAAPSQNELVKMLFPLPAEPLAIGESGSMPSKMPLNITGTKLMVKGSTTVTLKGYVTIESHVCAKFDIKIDISEMDVPEEMKGEYKCTTKGVGVLYFDTEDRCFHSGELMLVNSIRLKPGEPTSVESFASFIRNGEKEKEAQKK